MPLRAQRFNHRIRNRFAAPFTLRAIAISMTIDAPRVPVLFDKRGGGIERVAALGAEEVASVPFSAARDHDFALDRRFARLAARGEALVEIEVAVEPRRFVDAVLVF